MKWFRRGRAEVPSDDLVVRLQCLKPKPLRARAGDIITIVARDSFVADGRTFTQPMRAARDFDVMAAEARWRNGEGFERVPPVPINEIWFVAWAIKNGLLVATDDDGSHQPDWGWQVDHLFQA